MTFPHGQLFLLKILWFCAPGFVTFGKYRSCFSFSLTGSVLQTGNPFSIPHAKHPWSWLKPAHSSPLPRGLHGKKVMAPPGDRRLSELPAAGRAGGSSPVWRRSGARTAAQTAAAGSEEPEVRSNLGACVVRADVCACTTIINVRRSPHTHKRTVVVTPSLLLL